MTGTGPGGLTADGCAVEVYLELPAMGEADLVHAVAGAGASVLDLGAGVGRIAHGLVERGHEVVAVDQSAEMLAHVRGARTVTAPIAGLDLGRTFDAVLLASHLVNTPDAGERRALFDTARRHLAAGGVLVAEWHPPEWFDAAGEASGRAGEVRIELRDVHRDGDRLSATVRYWIGDELWTHSFTARRLTDQALAGELREAGLSFTRFASDDRTWFVAAPAADGGDLR